MLEGHGRGASVARSHGRCQLGASKVLLPCLYLHWTPSWESASQVSATLKRSILSAVVKVIWGNCVEVVGPEMKRSRDYQQGTDQQCPTGKRYAERGSPLQDKVEMWGLPKWGGDAPQNPERGLYYQISLVWLGGKMEFDLVRVIWSFLQKRRKLMNRRFAEWVHIRAGMDSHRTFCRAVTLSKILTSFLKHTTVPVDMIPAVAMLALVNRACGLLNMQMLKPVFSGLEGSQTRSSKMNKSLKGGKGELQWA